MKRLMVVGGCLSVTLAAIAFGAVVTGPEKYTVKVPGGLGFAEFKGYEAWETIAISENGPHIAVILGNAAMIGAYKAGIPTDGKPFPDGARMAKIHWVPKKNEIAPGPPTVPGALHDVDFMVKDSKRFADGGGWGYAAFKYDDASGKFSPVDETGTPPQGHDAKCGVACHTIVKNRDYVFTEYANR